MQSQLQKDQETAQEKAKACRSLGLLNRRQKNSAAAAAYFRQAAALDPQDHISLVNLAELFHENKDKKHAIEYYMRAVIAAPQELAYQKKFLELCITTEFTAHNDTLQAALLVCLNTPETDCRTEYNIWHGMLALNPRFESLYGGRSGTFNKKTFDRVCDYSALLDPYFLAVLKRVVVYEVPAFELFLIHLRRRLLENLGSGRKMFPAANDYIAVASALSHYCFSTDYILPVDNDERETLEGLRERLEAGVGSEENIAAYACYVPLYTLKNAAMLASFVPRSPQTGGVIKAQISDYLDLQERRKSIVSLTDIDAASQVVREQYEEFPYPRWTTLPAVSDPADKSVLAYFADKREALSGEGLKFLVAGCGTGHDPLVMAREFPQADILAIDLSSASLAYASRKAAEYNITNVTFRQADILKLGSINRQFDCITSNGVLHHMKEPMAGWRMLCGLLKPEGLMRISLYSEAARWPVVKAREVIARENYGHDADSMRQFRRKSAHVLDERTLTRLRQLRDYYSMPMYRDLLFHVQEERIDIPELGRRLEELDLVFDGFSLSAVDMAAKYAAMYPDDRIAHDLARWDAVEKKHPDMFIGMYQFWCRKKL